VDLKNAWSVVKVNETNVELRKINCARREKDNEDEKKRIEGVK
jgi:hypothetical protein